MPRRYYSSIAQRTTLSADINASQTSVTVAAVTGFPSSFPFTIIVDQDTVNEEVMEVSSRSGTTLTVVRGVDGTTAVSHTAGATVNHGVSARDFSEPNVFINEGGTLTAASASSTPLTVKGASAQSANLLNVRNSDDSARFVVAQNGVVGITSTSTPQTAMNLAFYSAAATARIVNMDKGRGTEASPAVVQDGDDLGVIQFRGYSGAASAFVNAAQIRAQVDGTPDSGGDTTDMPGRLVFYTTPDGTSNLTERMRINSAGDVGIGTTPSYKLHVYDATDNIVYFVGDATVSQYLVRYSTDASAAQTIFAKGRGTSASPSIVSSGDSVGAITWQARGTSAFHNMAQISAEVDGTPGTNDMPGRIRFLTTPDGSAGLSERMRIDNAGLITGTGSSLGAWTSYTPTFSGGTWAVGNGTFSSCSYVQIGKVVVYKGTFTFGSTTVKDATTALIVSLPVAALSGTNRGSAEILDSGTANYMAQCAVTSSGLLMRANAVSGSLITATGFTATNPITWATNDTFSWTVVYEAA